MEKQISPSSFEIRITANLENIFSKFPTIWNLCPFKNNLDFCKKLWENLVKVDDEEIGYKKTNTQIQEQLKEDPNNLALWWIYVLCAEYHNHYKYNYDIDVYPYAQFANFFLKNKDSNLYYDFLKRSLQIEYLGIKNEHIPSKLEKRYKSLMRIFCDIATFLVKNNHFKKAIEAINIAIDLYPKKQKGICNDPVAYGILATALIGTKIQENLKKAKSILEKLEKNRERKYYGERK